VVTIPAECSLAAALRRLAQANILSAPVADESGVSAGFVDVVDILAAVFERTEWGAGGLAAFLLETRITDIPRSNDAQMVYRTHGGMSLL
jgi:CBS domain-containing protein